VAEILSKDADAGLKQSNLFWGPDLYFKNMLDEFE
jgi:hypothetical protein